MTQNNKVQYIIITAVFLVIVFSVYKSSTKVENIQDNTITVNGTTLVFLEPEKDWIIRMQKENDTNLSKINSDNTIYGNLLKENYRDKNIKIVLTTKRYLNFIKDNGEKVVIDRNSINMDGWGAYIFDGKQDPMDVSLSTIQNENKGR